MSTPKTVNDKLQAMRKAITESSKSVNRDRQLSVEWYLRKIQDLGLDMVKRSTFMVSDLGTRTGSKGEGFLYMFAYDPKHKKTLPYYDTFPLVVPFDVQEDSMKGINLHYLPVRMRVVLFDKLLEHSINNSRLSATWELLGNFARFPEVKPCVKEYLFSHIMSRNLLKINAPDWRLAVHLPVESFQKATSLQVWGQSRKIVNGQLARPKRVRVRPPRP